MSDTEETTTPTTQKMMTGQERYGDGLYTARVKWFNRQTGWGFLSLTSSAEDHENDDIFVHWKSLNVEEELYKYLVNGEYVHININYTPDGEHSYQATNVCGVDGGHLMCQTRHNENESRRSDDGGDEEQQRGRQRPPRRTYHRGPRDGEEWQRVSRGGHGARPRRGGGRQNSSDM
jgi:cold shock CspA family protein